MSRYYYFSDEKIGLEKFQQKIHKLILIILFAIFISKISFFKPINYNQNRHIENSYQVIGILSKYNYIHENKIAEKSNMNEFELVFEWEWHNLIYYTDVFKILDSHTKDVDFG
jgi:hypothetical protein